MIFGPVVTCIYCWFYPPSCGSKQLCSSGCSIFNYEKKAINFRNSVQAPFHRGRSYREKKNHSSAWFLSRWSHFTDHPHCLSEYLCWLCHLFCEPCIVTSNLFFIFADIKHSVVLTAFVLWADVCRGFGMSPLRGKNSSGQENCTEIWGTASILS